MKVTGFSFIRNAVQYDYPIVEAIQSVLPLCDDFVVAVGKSDDDTLGLIRRIPSSKIKVVETVWDDALREGGRVLAAETEKAFRAVPADSDWAFYIQGDEVLHEQYYDAIREAMQQWKDDPHVDGLLFNYRHFYGSYDYVAVAPNWYRKEIRVVRNRAEIYSYRDAQGFRKGNNRMLNVKPVDAYIHHYGWVRHPRQMQQKIGAFLQMYYSDEWIDAHFAKADEFDYSGIDALTKFAGTHPAAIRERIEKINWQFDHDLKIRRMPWKYRMKMFVEQLTGYRLFEYRNYRIV